MEICMIDLRAVARVHRQVDREHNWQALLLV